MIRNEVRGDPADRCPGAEVAGTGFELPPRNTGNSSNSFQSGAESGALGALSAPIDPDLALLVKAWPGLPEAVKAKVVAMVREAKG